MRKLSESVFRRLAMSKTFRHTNWVLVLLASGALVVLVAFGALVMAHRSSSGKDQSERDTSSVEAAKETAPSKLKRTQARTAQAKAQVKAEPGSKESMTSTPPAGKPPLADPLSSMTP